MLNGLNRQIPPAKNTIAPRPHLGMRSPALFIRVDAQLRSVSHPQVFAVGDCAHWSGDAPAAGTTGARADDGAGLPKAGVYAVRMGPVLARNLRAALGQGAPVDYRPQRRFLALLATADRQAIAAWNGWSAQGPRLGRWLWRWKDRIDRGFLRRFERTGARARGPTAPQEDRA